MCLIPRIPVGMNQSNRSAAAKKEKEQHSFL